MALFIEKKPSKLNKKPKTNMCTNIYQSVNNFLNLKKKNNKKKLEI